MSKTIDDNVGFASECRTDRVEFTLFNDITKSEFGPKNPSEEEIRTAMRGREDYVFITVT